MSTTATPPAAPAAAPQAPAQAAKPATPPIPPAQAASVPAPKAAPASSRQPSQPPSAPPSIEGDLKKLAEEHFAKTKAPAVPKAEAPEAPAAAPKAEAPAKTPDAPKADKAPPAEKEPLDIPEPKGMSPEALGNWKTWREQAKKEITEARAARDALNAQLETYKKATPADNEKAARLEAQLKEAQDRLAVFDLKSHPDFVKQYVEPKKNALKEAAEIVAYNGKEGVDLAAILELPQKDFNAKVSELTKEMNGMDATTVQTALRQAHKLTADEKGALSKAGELKQQLAAKAASEARQAFERSREEIKAKVPVLQIPEGATEELATEFNEYNQAVTAAFAEAETYSFGKMSESDVARISHEAAMLKPMSKLMQAQDKRLRTAEELNRQLAAELAAIKKGKAAPSFTGGKESGSAQPDVSKMDFHQLAEYHFSKSKGR